jgi:hypothetical protein
MATSPRLQLESDSLLRAVCQEGLSISTQHDQIKRKDINTSMVSISKGVNGRGRYRGGSSARLSKEMTPGDNDDGEALETPPFEDVAPQRRCRGPRNRMRGTWGLREILAILLFGGFFLQKGKTRCSHSTRPMDRILPV